MENKTVKDIFTTYDVVDGYIKNERGNSLDEIRQHVISELKKLPLPVEYKDYGTTFNDLLDYFSLGTWQYKDKNKTWPTDYRWIACYYVTGGSEGYYFHIDVLTDDNKRELIFLGKTLIENRDLAAEINSVLAKIFQV